MRRQLVSGIALLVVPNVLGSHAFAQAVDTSPAAAAQAGGLEEIVVTAQKRSQSVNTVPMSITTLSGQALADRGVLNVEDLRKVVPSFNASPTRYGTPVYTLRGIGFYESSLAASPAVSVYVDEAPLPFAAMTRLVTLDLARIEVLKGPQGTLFGQNSTGGAINYIAAKPTEDFAAGVNASYGRFNAVDLDGYISGPLSSTLSARLSLKTSQAGAWQKSMTRDDKLGSKNQLVGRLLLNWEPTPDLHVSLNINGWRDHSEALASQLVSIAILNPTACVANPQVCISPELGASPKAKNIRDADWTPGRNYHRRDYMYQTVGRIDYDLSDALTLTSLTSYAQYKQNFTNDQDGTRLRDTEVSNYGKIRTFFQEGRLSYTDGGLDVILGANYQHDRVDDESNDTQIRDSSAVYAIAPTAPILTFGSDSFSRIRTVAAFGNVDYELSDRFKVHAGVRYTEVRTRNAAANKDTGDGTDANAINTLIGFLTGTFGTIPAGGYTTIDIQIDPTSPTGLRVTPLLVRQVFKEHNTSWRLGLDYTPTRDLLFYANVSQGYKSGSFPNLGGTAPIQYTPAKQEKVIAYEIGTKATLFDRALQLNAAGFYYDYSNKQVRGRVLDPLGIFGAIESLVNVPKSRLWGIEVQAMAQPVEGLDINIGGTYLNSKVTGSFVNSDPYGNSFDFKGYSYPYTPKWSFTGDIQYEWPLNPKLNGFLGASANGQSGVDAAFHNPAQVALVPSDPTNAPGVFLPGNIFRIHGYATMDLRAGVADPDHKWRATVWVRNVTNKLYVTNISQALDTTFRYVGMPRTFGGTFSYNF